MKKIGLCIAFQGQNNFGTILQAYCSVLVVTKLGYKCEIIIYKKKYTLSYIIKQIPRIFNSMVLKSIIRKYKDKINKKIVNSYTVGCSIRSDRIEIFKNKYFIPKSRVYYGYKKLCEGSKNYDMILVGSDQLWLPTGLATNFYNLMFVDDSVPKISYATSFGVPQIPFYQKSKTKHFLERFDAISVREISAKDIIASLTDKKVEVVLDPTLLLTREQWAEVIPEKKIINDSYIFCYFMGRNTECRDKANELKAKTGLKIVTLKHLDEYIAMDDEFGDESPYDIGPEDFVNLIRNAQYVCTDSFHGTVFSILYNKKFKTFYRFKQGSAHSRNTRIISLFNLLGLEDRIYRGTDIYQEINQSIDYNSVEEKLINLRKHSLEYLQNSLKIGDER